MKLNKYQENKLIEVTALFIINIAGFLISKFFIAITLGQCFIYSVIHSAWMPFLLIPLLKKIQEYRNGNINSYSLEPLKNYIIDFEKKQKEIQDEIKRENEELYLLQEKYKFDWKLFRKYLKRNHVFRLYHFTDEANLVSIIKNGGLFSWHYCQRNKIDIVRPGGSALSRQLDIKSNLQDYVRLSFTVNHPMMYVALTDGRIQNPVILEIDSDVVFLKDSIFSDKNANRTDAKIEKTFADFSKIRFDILTTSDYLSATEKNKPYFQAEVLIKEKILLDHIKSMQKITIK